jgi:phage tail-like protein
MPQFVENASHDPYQNFRFRIRWQGRHVAGVSKISALKETAVVAHREWENYESRKAIRPAMYEAITLERGLTCDNEFLQWVSSANNRRSGLAADPLRNDLRQDVVIEVYNEKGQVVLSYNVYRCWASEFQALPEFDRGANAVGIQSLRLENEGWEMMTED